MELISLELQGFRGLADQTIDLEPEPYRSGGLQPIVFIGTNGSGKSSLLKAILRLLSWFTRRLKNARTNGLPFQPEDIALDRSQVSAALTLVYQDQSYRWNVSRNRPKAFKTHKDSRKTDTKGSFYTELNQLVESFHGLMEQDIQTPLPVLVHYSTDRTVPQARVHLPKKRDNPIPLNAYDRALDEEATTFKSFFEWFRIREDYENQRRSKEDPRYQDPQLEAVRRACTLLTGLTDLQIRRETPVRMTVTKTIDGLPQIFRIEQLSDGEKGLLAMTGDIARRLAIANPHLSDPLQGEGVVLIDEIELHLHPQWQSSIIENLCTTFPNCQFILTTHSPQVITNLDWVYLLEPTPQGTRCQSIRTYGKDSNRILEAIMDAPSRSALLQQKVQHLFALIKSGKLEQAHALRSELLSDLDDPSIDPELIRASWLMTDYSMVEV